MYGCWEVEGLQSNEEFSTSDRSKCLLVKRLLLNLTLAHATTLLPGARGVPNKLLLVFLYRNVKGIAHIRAIEVPHTQHLGKRLE